MLFIQNIRLQERSMLNKILFICSITFSCFAGLQADATPAQRIRLNPNHSFQACNCGDEDKEGQKDLTPGALVCNESEDRCVNQNGDNEETSSSALFSVFCEDHQEDEKLLSCKDCQ